MKRNVWQIVLTIAIIYFFAFERALVGIWNGFSYVDEAFAIIVVIWMIFKVLVKKTELDDEDKFVFFSWIGILLIGIISNILSRLISNIYYIFIDMLSMIKVWLAYYTIILMNKDERYYNSIIEISAQIARVFVIIMFGCLILSYITNTGMTAAARHGIPSFKFWFNVPGNFSKLFYFIVPLLTADLSYKKSKYKYAIIGISLIIWASTMRSRAFAFIMIYIFLFIVFFIVKPTMLKKIYNPKKKSIYIIPVILIALIVNWNQIVFYFTTPTQARSVLLRYSVVTAVDYYPLGSGFGTYGSDVAATHYSQLYKKYDFNKYYGMKENNGPFLNDNYWPMVIAQFGIKGTIIVLFALYIFTKKNLGYTKNNKYFYVASLCANGFLILSSVASKSYCEYSSICVFILIGLFVKAQKIRPLKMLQSKN